VTSTWPYPSLRDPRWLLPPGPPDPALAAAREAVRGLLPAPAAARDDVLAAVSLARDVAERLDWVLLSLVGEARGRGASWEDVAGALGVSRQAAHKRFSSVVAEALARAGAVAPP
jgi:hypothetical protein